MTATTADTRSVVVEREMPHSAEKVWRALTQPHLVEEWLMKGDFKPDVGHKFTFRTAPTPHWNGVTDCEILVVEPLKKLSYTWNATGDEAATGMKTVVTWTLTPTKSGVLVRMEQSGFRPEQKWNIQGATYGWRNFIAALERVASEQD